MNPWSILAGVLIVIAAAGGGYYEGWSHRGDREAAVQLDLLKQKNVAIEVERVRADGLAAELEVSRREVRTVTVEVIKTIPSVTTVYVEKPGETPQAIPAAVVVWGAVRLYNRALRPDLPAGAGEFAYPPGATELTRAKIDTPDILAVHAENAGKYAECRAQLNKLIDFELGRQAPAAAADQ